MLDYLDVLKDLHETRRPRTYLEIGVFRGDSLRLVRENTVGVGVDPEPLVPAGDERHCQIEATTSDEFFASSRPRELFGGRPVDMVFIDGLHLFEHALRDFVNAEAIAAPESLIVVHDCLPADAVMASRVRTTVDWTGDVWKLVLCLLDNRPDLDLSILDVPPSGLCLIGRLDPGNLFLGENYDAVVEEYGAMSFEESEARRADLLRRTTRTPEALLWSSRREVERLHGQLAEAHLEVLRLRSELARQASTLAAVYRSRSWRLSLPVRLAGSVLRDARARWMRSRPRGR